MFLSVICDKCNKPVSHVMQTYYGGTDEYVFVAYCHGKSDRCRVPASIFSFPWRITEAKAFRELPGKDDPLVEAEKTGTEIVPFCKTVETFELAKNAHCCL